MFGRGKEKAVAAPPVTLKKDGDDLGRYPNDVDSNPSQARAQERALRAVSLVAIVAGMMCVALIMLIITLLPLQKVYPYLVTFKNQDNQVVSIEPMSANAPGMLYATEDAVRDYVVQRHGFTPSAAVMTAQWGPNSRLAARSGAELFAKFTAASKEETTRMMTLGYARTITINAVNRISADTWQVDFTTHDQLPTSGGTLTPQAVAGAPADGGSAPTAPSATGTSGSGFAGGAAATSATAVNNQSWVATMRVDYQPQRITYDKRLLNPLGFTVTDYSVTRSTR